MLVHHINFEEAQYEPYGIPEQYITNLSSQLLKLDTFKLSQRAKTWKWS
jgi:hypothetical protein